MEPEKGFTEHFTQEIAKGSELANEDISKQKEILRKRFNEVKAKINNLTEKYALGKIDDDIYSAMIAQYKKERFQLENELGTAKTCSLNEFEKFSTDIKYANIAHERFTTGSFDVKKEILGNLQSNLEKPFAERLNS